MGQRRLATWLPCGVFACAAIGDTRSTLLRRASVVGFQPAGRGNRQWVAAGATRRKICSRRRKSADSSWGATWSATASADWKSGIVSLAPGGSGLPGGRQPVGPKLAGAVAERRLEGSRGLQPTVGGEPKFIWCRGATPETGAARIRASLRDAWGWSALEPWVKTHGYHQGTAPRCLDAASGGDVGFASAGFRP
jgi:hypothetical protein